MTLPSFNTSGELEAPVSDHPETSTGSGVTFVSSTHSSAVETEDPAQATSEITTDGDVAANDLKGKTTHAVRRKKKKSFAFGS